MRFSAAARIAFASAGLPRRKGVPEPPVAESPLGRTSGAPFERRGDRAGGKRPLPPLAAQLRATSPAFDSAWPASVTRAEIRFCFLRHPLQLGDAKRERLSIAAAFDARRVPVRLPDADAAAEDDDDEVEKDGQTVLPPDMFGQPAEDRDARSSGPARPFASE
jgi:hypothetical protein